MQQAQQIDGLAFDAPRPANAEIAELGGLVGGVPALHDALEAIRLFVLTIALEPFGLDQAVAQWGGGLLILVGKVVLANDLLAQFPLCCRVWRRAAPDTTTGQVPPGSIRATYQQESGSDVDRYRDALMPRMRKLPPDAGKRETDPESSTPGEVKK